MFTKPVLDDALLEEIKADIKKAITQEQYENIDKSVMDDFAKMAAYLRKATPEEIAERLKPLSDELEARYKALGMIEEVKNPDGSTSKKVIPSPSGIQPHNVFTSVIENWTKQNGFNQGGKAHCIVTEEGKQVRKLIDLPDKIPTLFGAISVPSFRGLLSSGYLFKDIGAGKGHGEFTHILTLIFLAEANKAEKFLTHDPSELYKMLGNEFCFQPRETRGELAVWDILFDQQFKTDIHNAPEIFNKFLREKLGSIESTQVLSSMLHSRYLKRDLVETKSTQDSGKKAAEKFATAPGLLLDEKIFFSLPYNGTQLKAAYDEVTDTCHYDVALKDKFPLPKININKDSPLIDQVITLFDTKNWQGLESVNLNSNTKELAQKIHDTFLQMKNKFGDHAYIPHRLIAETLENLIQTTMNIEIDMEKLERVSVKQKSDYRADDYIHFLVNESKKMLLDHDAKDIDKTMTQTSQLEEIDSKVRGLKL